MTSIDLLFYNQILNTNLNKYMINIIYDYVVPNIEKLKIIPKTRQLKCVGLKIPFFDIVIKAIHIGFIGVSMSKYHYDLLFKNQIKDENGKLDYRLDSVKNSTYYCFKLKETTNDLYHIDICFIDDIFDFETEIRSNY